MNKSESIKELAVALTKAQAELKNPSFDATNPHFKNRYASLAGVRDTVTPTLSKHGLSIVQLLESDDSGPICETVLIHTSGEWISSRLHVPASKLDAQGFGSAITYARRYALQATLNVVGDADDDGEAAAKAPITPTAGVWESLDEDEQKFLTKIATEVSAFIVEGDVAGAVGHVRAQGLQPEEQVALNTRFNSKERSAMKKWIQENK